ncbi:hypothetical protein Vafri_16581 [Volvox africanus]|uniref:Ion transport domain-containing protein n=1 Tax=Volvox africanus TaxID=51714 RepID=A0A8J4BIM0_9CHLO|nr:hypothetical protein Vafri_16581 [Volvox africanus]
MSNLSRQPSLTPHVRSTAAIAEAEELSGPPTPTDDVGLPGGIYTPTRNAPGDVLPPRARKDSLSSSPSNTESIEIPYRFTLADLNARSYFLIHEAAPDAATRSTSLLVNRLRGALRQAVALANVEVCLIRNCQLAGQPVTAPVGIDLTRSSPVEPSEPAAERIRRATENASALAPIADLLSQHMHFCTLKDVRGLLEDMIQEADKILTEPSCAEGLGEVEDAVLHELAFTFAAYQPAVLDEELKGSQSPYDPRSHTHSIADVRALVEGSVRAAGTTAPESLARLAIRLLDALRLQRPISPLAGWLLQGAFMSGNVELVSKLLARRSTSGLFELDIIRRLRAAWLGYTRYRPLQAGRSGVKAQTIDWLDFKCSCARAVLIAHKIVETLILRNDKDLTQSVQMAAAAAAPLPSPPPSPPAGDPSLSLLVANAGGGGAEPGPPQQSCLENRPQRKAVVIALPPAAVTLPSVLCDMADVTRCRLLDDDSDHVELEPAKWVLVKELFPRAAACKPLALAMLHLVLAGKREVQREARAAAAATTAASSVSAATELPLPYTDKEDAGGASLREEEDEEGVAEAEAVERTRMEEEAHTVRYRKLHLLAVQACHLAVHSGSLSTVSDAVACIRAVRAWPSIDMAMLNDLAGAFPHQCAALLSAIPLQEVDLEDNVLPFALPPGFTTVAVSDKDAHEFRQGGGTGSTQDAEHFATQRETDASIEASLLVLPRTWLALLFLFWPVEFLSPTTRQLLRVLRCAVAAFLWQGPGSCAVAAVFTVLLLVAGAATRSVVAVARILYYGILYRIWSFVTAHFPAIRQAVYRICGRPVSVGPVPHVPTGIGRRLATMHRSVTGGPAAVTAAGNGDGDEEGEEGFTRQLGLGIWRTFFAHGHNALIDWAVGWGKGSASISCRKLPMPVVYTSQSGTSLSPGGQRLHQLDTALLEKLLKTPGLHPSVFGSKVLRALILFKWNYFTKYFIILQLLLHITYMGIFLAYAFSIKDMEPVDGRESGPGANTAGCQLQAPTPKQTGLLIVLGVMTVDFLVQELRQIRHFGWLFFTHTWDLLDACSVALVVASVTLHFSCTSGVSPLTLRGLASVQIVLLFMRLLYYAMASDKLGSFVRMVLETTYDLVMFFAFLSVVFVGFALAIIVSQGTFADEEQTFIKLFTMMYGDFDVNFLSTLDSGALGLDALTRVLASVYMILVTIILLNLLISVISESYERIRENEKWESLRNKALLVVESETQLWQFFLTWLYTTLTPPSQRHCNDNGKRYLYVIAPEYARRLEADGDEDDEDEDEAGDEDEDDDGQWNGRLGEMKRHITTQARATVDVLRREVCKIQILVEGVGRAAAAAATAASIAPGVEVEVSGGDETGAAVRDLAGASNVAELSRGEDSGPTALLDERSVQLLVEQVSKEVGALVSKEVAALRNELRAEIAKTGPAQQKQQGHGGRLTPLPNATSIRPSLPHLTVVSSPASAPPGGTSPSGEAAAAPVAARPEGVAQEGAPSPRGASPPDDAPASKEAMKAA